MTPWRACVLTLFPDMFPGPLGHSLAGKALADGLWSLSLTDIRDFAFDRHGSVDDAPFGGGPGMVMRPDVTDAAIRACEDAPGPLIFLTPRGRLPNRRLIADLAAGPGVRLLCARYEGVDQRVIDRHQPLEISLGDFVLSGGEPAAMALLDACLRLVPGVVGSRDSLIEESFEGGLLEYPHYTRPAEWDGMAVPETLLSGHHQRIRDWRHSQAEQVTRERRPDLWAAWRSMNDNEQPIVRERNG